MNTHTPLYKRSLFYFMLKKIYIFYDFLIIFYFRICTMGVMFFLFICLLIFNIYIIKNYKCEMSYFFYINFRHSYKKFPSECKLFLEYNYVFFCFSFINIKKFILRRFLCYFKNFMILLPFYFCDGGGFDSTIS